MSLKLCKGLSKTPLTPLNESVDANTEKFVYSGVFTQCSVPGHVVINRNNRSYPEKTVLKHLGYLRESIKANGSLLGELDHPEGRFDIRLADASHKITDLWYDQDTHCVMGKLELLDTPNGRTAMSLVKAGYPLFVSSRAAGDVDEKTHEVEIAQIFTYDIVCTPGFAEARLERVNESALTTAAKKYLNECLDFSAKNPLNKALNIKTSNVEVYALNEAVKIDEKTKNAIRKPVDIKELCKPLLEEDENFTLPTAETDPNKVDEDGKDDDEEKDVESEAPEKPKKIEKKDDVSESDDEDDEKSDEGDSESKEEMRSKILSISAEDEEGDSTKDTFDAEDTDKDEMRSKILGIEGVEAVADEDEDDDEEDEKVEEAKDRASKIAKDTKSDIEDFKAVLDSVKKAESVKESIIRRYPFTISLSESNFAKFAALRPEKKKKCNDFIVEHQIFDIEAINELWTTPLQDEKRAQQNWLKLASKSDIDLYVKAPVDVQNAIEESAKYVILETQEDVDDFWQKTGLRQAAARRQMNERFNSEYGTKAESRAQKENPLGYDYDWVRITEDYMNDMF